MIVVANFLASDLDAVTRGICSVLQSRLDIEVWHEAHAELPDFRDARVGLGLVCGLAYTLLHEADPRQFEPVAAPVVRDGHGFDRPLYCAEVVVPVDSGARSLPELAGARFTYNETASFSGYRALERELAAGGLGWDLFGECLRSGSHHESLRRVASGAADAAAIDSHVLALAQKRDPGLAARLRVIASLGPYPAPPLAVNRRGCEVPNDKLCRLLAALPPEVVAGAAIERWQPVDDAYYDTIREAAAGLPGLSVADL